MEIKDILNVRKKFANSFQKYIKMNFSKNHELFNSYLHDEYNQIIQHFNLFHKGNENLKNQLLDLEIKIQETNQTINQISKTDISTKDFEQLKTNLEIKRKQIKEKIESQSINHFKNSFKVLEQFEELLCNELSDDTKYPIDLKEQEISLRSGFPSLLDFCYAWESDNLFYFSKINKECFLILSNVQKALKNVNKLKDIQSNIYNTKEYKQLTELLQVISKNIDTFTNDQKQWSYIENYKDENTQLLSFKTIFERKDFKSIRSKIRIFSNLEKTEELIKIVKTEFRNVEKVFSVYLYQLEVQKKEIFKLCLPTPEYKKFLIKNWVNKEFQNYIEELRIIEEQYEKKLLRF